MAESQTRPITKHQETIEWLLKQMLHIPRAWLVLCTIFILLSMLNIGWVPRTRLALTFQVTNTTALFLALTWLPALLRVFALLGGGLKTPIGEVSSSGIDMLAKFLDADELGSLIQEATKAEETAPAQERQEAQQVRQELEEAYVGRVPAWRAREEMLNLAQRYKNMRENMKASPERTRLMNSLAEQMRLLAPFAKFSPHEIINYLQSDDQGNRLLGLSIVRVSESSDYFDLVLSIIDHPKSAHEQWHALRAMQSMISQLSKEQKDRLREVLKRQRDYDKEKRQWIKPGDDRYLVSAQLLREIDFKA